MNKKDKIERDISLTFDFLRHLVDHPEMVDEIPDGTEVEFIGSDVVKSEVSGKQDLEEKPTLVKTRRVFELQTPSGP